MMLSEDELPPTPQEKLFIKHSVNECRASLAASTDDLARAIMDPILDRLIRALKKDVIEVECKPEDDWVLKSEEVYRSKTSNLQIQATKYQDVVEKVLFKQRWHFEFHETGAAPKYVVFFKCFGETFGKRPEDIEKMQFDANGVLVPSSPKVSEKDREKEKEKEKKRRDKEKEKKKRSKKLLEVPDLESPSKRHSKREKVTAAAAAAQRERDRRTLQRKESNLSNSSSSRN